MGKFIRSSGLKLVSLAIAIMLWVQVHGDGEGALSMDVALQVQGLPSSMIIVNDLPDQVRVTVSGLQSRMNGLTANDIRVPLDASEINEPGVIERALNVSNIHLPVGLRVEKILPDRIELQVDRLVTRRVIVQPEFNIPEGWKVSDVRVDPAQVELSGPEVWLGTLTEVNTAILRLDLHVGEFKVDTSIDTPAGKAIRLKNPSISFHVQGRLSRESPISVKEHP